MRPRESSITDHETSGERGAPDDQLPQRRAVVGPARRHGPAHRPVGSRHLQDGDGRILGVAIQEWTSLGLLVFRIYNHTIIPMCGISVAFAYGCRPQDGRRPAGRSVERGRSASRLSPQWGCSCARALANPKSRPASRLTRFHSLSGAGETQFWRIPPKPPIG
jgi:hypothetical protein